MVSLELPLNKRQLNFCQIVEKISLKCLLTIRALLEDPLFDHICNFAQSLLNHVLALPFSIFVEAREMGEAAVAAARTISDKRRSFIVRPLLEAKPARHPDGGRAGG